MTENLTTYDPVTALVDDEEIAFFMADALETGDASTWNRNYGKAACRELNRYLQYRSDFQCCSGA